MFEKRVARAELVKLLPIVDIYYERLSKFFDRFFKFEKIPISGFSLAFHSASLPYFCDYRFRTTPPCSYMLCVTEDNLNEFTKLQFEFETEFMIAKNLTLKLTHKFFPNSEAALYDNSLKEKLDRIGVKYTKLINSISTYKLYKSK